MKLSAGIFALLLGLAALSPARLYGEERFHTVQRGETFYSIARGLGIKAEDLMKFNGISDPARLREGQRLKIPDPAASPVNRSAASPSVTVYQAVRGDTFFSIARRFSVSEKTIRELNKLSDNYVLKVGDTLKIPAEAGPTGSQSPGVRTEPRPTETRTVNPQLSWPVAARELSYMTGKLSGVVITGNRQESVKSLTRGTVISAGPFQGFGRVAIIQVEGGYLYVYGGCESLSVKEGDKVSPGTELGKLGIDAVSNKPQLFFMVYRSNSPVDPAKAPRA